MTVFLFWNINEKPIEDLISIAARENSVDVLMLAECNISPTRLQLRLNRDSTDYIFTPTPGCKKIDIYTKFGLEFMYPILETDRLTIRRLQLPGTTDILLAVVHFM